MTDNRTSEQCICLCPLGTEPGPQHSLVCPKYVALSKEQIHETLDRNRDERFVGRELVSSNENSIRRCVDAALDKIEGDHNLYWGEFIACARTLAVEVRRLRRWEGTRDFANMAEIEQLQVSLARQLANVGELKEENGRLRELCAESAKLMSEDFPDDPKDVDFACVSPRYLAHYKALLAVGIGHVETTSPQAPIANVMVDQNGKVVSAYLYAPSLPSGTHDLYCEPPAPGGQKVPHPCFETAAHPFKICVWCPIPDECKRVGTCSQGFIATKETAERRLPSFEREPPHCPTCDCGTDPKCRYPACQHEEPGCVIGCPRRAEKASEPPPVTTFSNDNYDRGSPCVNCGQRWGLHIYMDTHGRRNICPVQPQKTNAGRAPEVCGCPYNNCTCDDGSAGNGT